jgi:sugar phosphate isomerase/epimerase
MSGEGPGVALQLFTVREALAADRKATLRRLGDCGFTAVETAGPIGTTAALTRAELGEFGLVVVGSYFLGAPSEFGSFVDEQASIGNHTIVSMFGPDRFADADSVRRAADEFSSLAELADSAGSRLGYHNHSWEWRPQVDSSHAFDVFVDELDPRVFLEFDYYWAAVGGAGDVGAGIASRIRRLHVKDGPLTDSPSMSAIGEGAFDVLPTIASQSNLEWAVIAFDESDDDAFEASVRGREYLVDSGLVRPGPVSNHRESGE